MPKPTPVATSPENDNRARISDVLGEDCIDDCAPHEEDLEDFEDGCTAERAQSSRPHASPAMSAASSTNTAASAPEQRQGMSGPGQKGKRTRTVLTPYQSRVLRRVLDQTPFPSTELRNSLAAMLNIRARTIQIWFQNQRQKAKTRTSSESGPQALGSNGPKPSTHMVENLSMPEIAPETIPNQQNVRWTQFHGAVRNAVPGGYVQDPQQQQANAIPHQRFDQRPRSLEGPNSPIESPSVSIPRSRTLGNGLDILASIASQTTVPAQAYPQQQSYVLVDAATFYSLQRQQQQQHYHGVPSGRQYLYSPPPLHTQELRLLPPLTAQTASQSRVRLPPLAAEARLLLSASSRLAGVNGQPAIQTMAAGCNGGESRSP